MMQLVTSDYYGEFIDGIADMHRLRFRVFKERLDWHVEVSGGMEIDEFDALHPAYLIQRALDTKSTSALLGCGLSLSRVSSSDIHVSGSWAPVSSRPIRIHG
jgi:N-acyl-L-homoserine lactone synthetase